MRRCAMRPIADSAGTGGVSAGHQATTEHPIEFCDAGWLARVLPGLDIGQAAYRAGAGQGGKTTGCNAGFHRLVQGIPLAAMRAFAFPFGTACTTLTTNKYGFCFSHRASLTAASALPAGDAASAINTKHLAGDVSGLVA